MRCSSAAMVLVDAVVVVKTVLLTFCLDAPSKDFLTSIHTPRLLLLRLSPTSNTDVISLPFKPLLAPHCHWDQVHKAELL